MLVFQHRNTTIDQFWFHLIRAQFSCFNCIPYMAVTLTWMTAQSLNFVQSKVLALDFFGVDGVVLVGLQFRYPFSTCR